MTTLARLCAADAGLLLATPYKVVNLNDNEGQQHCGPATMLARGTEARVDGPLPDCPRPAPRFVPVSQFAGECRLR
jgi:hypothetical protein